MTPLQFSTVCHAVLIYNCREICCKASVGRCRFKSFSKERSTMTSSIEKFDPFNCRRNVPIPKSCREFSQELNQSKVPFVTKRATRNIFEFRPLCFRSAKSVVGSFVWNLNRITERRGEERRGQPVLGQYSSPFSTYFSGLINNLLLWKCIPVLPTLFTIGDRNEGS